MNRRGRGVAILLAATALVVPRLVARQLPGSGSAAPVAAAPTVGACLTQNPANVPTTSVRGADGLSGPDVGSCRATHFGEIIALVKDGAEFPHSVINQLSSVDVSYCNVRAEAYLGLSQRASAGGTPGQAEVGFGFWYPAQRGRVQLLGPSPRQQQLGQIWVACALYGDGAYQGSVRDVFAGHALPPQFAVCRTDLTGSRGMSCGQPHPVEIFGTASLTGRQIDPKALTQTCRAMVQATTRIPDPTGGGRLAITASVFHTDTTGRVQPGPPGPGEPESASALCAVSVIGRGDLTGTLFGWGAHPLPLS